jgi:hypothetical protein
MTKCCRLLAVTRRLTEWNATYFTLRNMYAHNHGLQGNLVQRVKNYQKGLYHLWSMTFRNCSPNHEEGKEVVKILTNE